MSATSSAPATPRRLAQATAATAVLVTAALAGTATPAAARPAAPSSLAAHVGGHGAYLEWNSGAADGYEIEQSTDSSFDRDVTTYTTRDQTRQFTPYGLSPDRQYFFRIRSTNGTTQSPYSPVVHFAPRSQLQPVKVLSYNILRDTRDGAAEGGNRIAPWSRRKKGVVSLIRAGNPDVIALQEAGPWTGRFKGPRQVDSVRAAFHGHYALARTEIPPGQPHFFRTGDYLLYRKSTLKAVGKGGFWTLSSGGGGDRFAAHQLLQNRQTGARFLAISTHLQTGSGRTIDMNRQRQTQRLLKLARAFASKRHVPIIFAGDFNSHVAGGITHDGPGIAMSHAHMEDAAGAAQSLTNARFDSANRYRRRPPQFGHNIDHIFTSPGVGMVSFRMLLHEKHGKLTGVIPSDHNPIEATMLYPFS